MVSKNGLLIEYNFCTGCHTCEVACQQEHDFPAGKNGINVTEFPTDLCDLCINRYQQGEEPACVKHCQARVMQFGPISKLATEMENRPKMVLFAPR
jgi:Fe-S-cluster-containing dehydrogenase component